MSEDIAWSVILSVSTSTVTLGEGCTSTGHNLINFSGHMDRNGPLVVSSTTYHCYVRAHPECAGSVPFVPVVKEGCFCKKFASVSCTSSSEDMINHNVESLKGEGN